MPARAGSHVGESWLGEEGSMLHRGGDGKIPNGEESRRASILRIEHLTKRFEGVTVLDDVSLVVLSGEVHGLAGHNGSGKSTLIKCLSGFHQPSDPWRVEAAGRVLTRPLQPGEAAQLGVAFVHQDLGLLPDLTVLENLLLFRVGLESRPFIAWRREASRARRLFDTFGIRLDPGAPLSALRPVEQAQVAIVRALSQLRELRSRDPGAHGVLVLDEATTFLDRPGRSVLHALLRSISSEGYGVLFVSHDVDELLAVTDRITVLREGRVVGTVRSSEVGHDEVVNLIVSGGREPATSDAQRPHEPRPRVPGAEHEHGQPRAATSSTGRGELRVEGLAGAFLRRADLVASEGEILGLTGIVGGGWELVPELLYGSRRAASGTVQVAGRLFTARRASPVRSLRTGMIYVPADRHGQGVISQLSVQENVMLPVLDRHFRRGHLQFARIACTCRELLDRHFVQPARPEAPMSSLSGGNQQKAVLGKWLQLSPRVVLLNEPTQGVDVGARALITEEIRRLADGGAVVLYASGNWDEIARIADRVVVVADGVVAAELSPPDVTVEAIAIATYRGTQQRSTVRAAAEIWEQIQ